MLTHCHKYIVLTAYTYVNINGHAIKQVPLIVNICWHILLLTGEGEVGSLRVIPSIHRDAARAAGFETESLVDTIIIHVDTIAHKLKLLPHFTDNSKLIVIRTHETR